MHELHDLPAFRDGCDAEGELNTRVVTSDSSPDSLVCVYAMAAVDVDASQLFFKSKAEKQRRAVCQVMCMNYSMRGGTDYHSQAIVAQKSSDSL